MFHHILLPLDLTDRHQPALTHATDLVQASQGTVTLLHVIEVMLGLPLDEERSFYNRLERAARARLDPLVEQLRVRGLTSRQEIVFGNRAGEIVRFAADNNCDLIVLTAPRLDPAAPAAGWGSVSYKVGLLAKCPVLLVK